MQKFWVTYLAQYESNWWTRLFVHADSSEMFRTNLQDINVSKMDANMENYENLHWSFINQNPVANPCIICTSHKKLRLPEPFISTITIILYSQGAANWAPKWPWSCLQWSLSQPVATNDPWQAPHLPHRDKRGTWRCICFRAEVTGAAGHIVLWRSEVRWKREE